MQVFDWAYIVFGVLYLADASINWSFGNVTLYHATYYYLNLTINIVNFALNRSNKKLTIVQLLIVFTLIL